MTDSTNHPPLFSDIAPEAGTSDVEITAAMIEAGSNVICEFFYESVNSDDPLVRGLASEVFLAMSRS